MEGIRKILRFQSDCAGRNRMLFVHEQNSVWQIAAGIQDECRCVSQQPNRSLTAWIFKCACRCQPGTRRLRIVRCRSFQQKTVIVSPAGLKLLKAYRIRSGLDGRAQTSLFSKIKGSICHRNQGDREMIFIIDTYLIGMNEQFLMKRRLGKVSRQVPVGMVRQVDISCLICPCVLFYGKLSRFCKRITDLIAAVARVPVQPVRLFTGEKDRSSILHAHDSIYIPEHG